MPNSPELRDAVEALFDQMMDEAEQAPEKDRALARALASPEAPVADVKGMPDWELMFDGLREDGVAAVDCAPTTNTQTRMRLRCAHGGDEYLLINVPEPMFEPELPLLERMARAAAIGIETSGAMEAFPKHGFSASFIPRRRQG